MGVSVMCSWRLLVFQPALMVALVLMLALSCGNNAGEQDAANGPLVNLEDDQTSEQQIQIRTGLLGKDIIDLIPNGELNELYSIGSGSGFTASRTNLSDSLGSQQLTGIWVSGLGSVTTSPDLAIVSIGVEARASTVTQARYDSASAMNRIVVAILAEGVKDQDIQTQHLNISPQYTYVKRKDSSGGHYNEQVLVGYIVRNQASIKIRDVNKVGEVVDLAAKAGGDLVRIHGIRFSVEDPTHLHEQARTAAVQDAIAKARQYASVANVILGRPIYISEVGTTPNLRAGVARESLKMATAAPVTPISGGQLSAEATVQVVFVIQ
jgi:uncharacterized protein YggE